MKHHLSSWRRRDFLATTIALGGTALLPRWVSAAETTRLIPAGFLGTGYSHFKEKHKLIAEAEGWLLVGLCEEDEAVRAQGPAGARWLSVDELFARAEVVIVESAVQHHARDAKRALRAGKNMSTSRNRRRTRWKAFAS